MLAVMRALPSTHCVLDEVLGVAVCILEDNEKIGVVHVVDAAVVQPHPVHSLNLRRTLEAWRALTELPRQHASEEHLVCRWLCVGGNRLPAGIGRLRRLRRRNRRLCGRTRSHGSGWRRSSDEISIRRERTWRSICLRHVHDLIEMRVHLLSRLRLLRDRWLPIRVTTRVWVWHNLIIGEIQ